MASCQSLRITSKVSCNIDVPESLYLPEPSDSPESPFLVYSLDVVYFQDSTQVQVLGQKGSGWK